MSAKPHGVRDKGRELDLCRPWRLPTTPGSSLLALTPPKGHCPASPAGDQLKPGGRFGSWPGRLPMTDVCPQPRCAFQRRAYLTFTFADARSCGPTPQPVIPRSPAGWAARGLSVDAIGGAKGARQIELEVGVDGDDAAGLGRFAPWITARLAARPNTATVSPGCTLAVFFTAPRPVVATTPAAGTPARGWPGG